MYDHQIFADNGHLILADADDPSRANLARTGCMYIS